MDTKEKPLNAEQAAEFLDIKLSHLYQLTHRNKIKFSKPNGGKLYFRREWLIDYINNGVSLTDAELEAEADQLMANRGLQ